MTSAAPPLANVPSASASASTSANAAAAPGASSGGHQSRPVAWGMVGSVFVAYGITIGLQYAFGIIYIVLLDAFGSSRAATAWVGSLSTGILEIAAVLSGLLVSKTSARFCALVGGLLTFAGLFLSSFATELWHMYITFGLLVGLGHALVFPVGIITVNQVSNRTLPASPRSLIEQGLIQTERLLATAVVHDEARPGCRGWNHGGGGRHADLWAAHEVARAGARLAGDLPRTLAVRSDCCRCGSKFPLTRRG